MLTPNKGLDQHAAETIKKVLRTFTDEELATFLYELRAAHFEILEAA